ncbi:MAG: hypothetical protein ASARMPREDX12_000574 [Alectoria sarmentosa]|nr:MAG: hypothetical protein ASARMPREDX12_000574 [Alectoria sarmentosa]
MSLPSSFASAATDPAQFAAFETWSSSVFAPQIDQAIGGPGLDSIDKILDQYSSMRRTPSGLDLGAGDAFHGFRAMKIGFLFLGVETYFSTVGGGREGPFGLRKVVEEKESGVVEVECTKEVGGVETVVATWWFVKKEG